MVNYSKFILKVQFSAFYTPRVCTIDFQSTSVSQLTFVLLYISLWVVVYCCHFAFIDRGHFLTSLFWADLIQLDNTAWETLFKLNGNVSIDTSEVLFCLHWTCFSWLVQFEPVNWVNSASLFVCFFKCLYRDLTDIDSLSPIGAVLSACDHHVDCQQQHFCSHANVLRKDIN